MDRNELELTEREPAEPEPADRGARARWGRNAPIIPPVVAAHVPRPGLTAALAASHSLPLVVVSAPAGTGKTTAVADWVRTEPGGTVCWVSFESLSRPSGTRCWTPCASTASASRRAGARHPGAAWAAGG